MELAVKDPLVGLVIGGRYRMLARIARGGMATVYRALDERLDREVAVKVMHPHLADAPQFLSRFQDEARAAARLSHPAVVAVGDQGVSDSGAWLAMELLTGRTVRDEIADRGRFTLAEAAAVMEPLLSGLAAAHEAGIIHRDVKPENILATGAPLGGHRPAYKVSDFGLARALGSGGSLTQSVMGTPAYIAPEQARDGRIDARVDIYSAGIVLFEMLTGRQPFTAESPVEVILAHIGRDVPPVSRAVGPVFGDQTDEVDSLVAWACARDPQLRPMRATDLLDEMRRVWAGFPSAALHAREASAPTGPATPVNPGTVNPGTVNPGTVNPGTFDPGMFGRVEAVGDATVDWTAGADRTTGPAAPAADAARWFDAIEAPGDDPTDGSPTRYQPVLDGYQPVTDNGTVALPREHVVGPVGVTSTPLVPHVASAAPDWADDDRPDMAPLDSGRPEERFAVSRGATRRRSEQTLGVVLLIAMIAALVVAGLVWWSQVGPGAYTVTPGVTGLTADEATRQLGDAGLGAGTEEVFSDVVAAGTVVSTRPAAGERVREDGEVTLAVSQGPELVAVPEVVGMSAADATAAVTGAGLLQPETVEAFDDSVAVGTVISADPATGTPTARDVPVRLTVSKGPEPRLVPEVVGQTLDAAQRAITDAGLTVGTVTEQYDEAIADRVVLSQSPESSTVAPGTAVDLVVSLGSPQVEVPDVLNQPTDEAVRTLEDLELVVERNGTSFLERVIQQDPPPGTLLAPGSTVTLTTF